MCHGKMKRLHIVPGVDDPANGLAVVARLLAKEQGDAEVVDLNDGLCRIDEADCDEVWIHGMWLPKEWQACKRVLKSRKKLVRMTHGSLSPIYLERQGKWKKRLVGPIERFFLRQADCIVATCATEKEWIEAYLGKRCPRIEVTDLKRFFGLGRVECTEGNDSRVEHVERVETERVRKGSLHLLYLGRRHPLKGLEFLEEALEKCGNVKAWKREKVEAADEGEGEIEFRVESSVLGEEKERMWEWCDVLVLPTLSENFGLVIAEALERGKRVITTDGAPAWGDGNTYGGRLVYLKGYLNGSREERISLLGSAIVNLRKGM
jgi:glycosyltransferase involved in cell wall biosynthesis